jgi:ABC-type Mn2+/Zn2+ transport system ATPase subunit
MLELKDVSIFRPGETTPDHLMVSKLSCDLQEGCGIGIIGPNGSGKSTLVKTIFGLQPLLVGSIIVKDHIKVGYMPQNYRNGVLSWLSAGEHFSVTLTDGGRRIAHSFLDDIGFQPNLGHRLAHMSGGELQILILATLIGQDSKLLLLDEPLSAIDFIRRRRLLDRLKHEIDVNKRGLLMVSHHMDDAKFLCGNVIVLSGRSETPHRKLVVDDNLDLMKVF